jgi:hypothetical protein
MKKVLCSRPPETKPYVRKEREAWQYSGACNFGQRFQHCIGRGIGRMALIFLSVVSQSTSTGEIKAEAEHGGLASDPREIREEAELTKGGKAWGLIQGS